MYDSAEELLRKIRLGEDTSLELKSVTFRGDKVAAPKRDDLADEIAAIANATEGVLILGVDDKTHEIEGIPVERLESLERYVFEICNDSIKEPVLFRSYRIELPDSSGNLRPLLKVEIPRSLFIHKSPGGYFIRQGSSKREMSTELLLRIGQQRSQARLIPFDEQAVPETSLSTLDPELRRRFRGLSQADEVTTLRKMKLLVDDSAGRERASVAGVLMCARSPANSLRGAVIQAVRYRGNKLDSNYQRDAREITGPLDEQIRSTLAFVSRNMSIAALKDPARVDVPQFSLRAVFEAIVNAAAHRDYSIQGSKIRLFMFDDRLELFSPGALPNTVTVDSLALRQSTRNELLTTLLARCPVEETAGEIGRSFFMEKRGEGVPIIIDETLKLSGNEPVYRVIDDSELLLTLPSALAQAAERGNGD